jgi:VCBS repeat-containing protein
LLAADLIAQWRADDLNVNYSDGAVVAAWPDSISGIAAAATGSPRLVRQALGARSAVRFDASDGGDLFRVRAANSPMAGARDFSVVVVFATASADLAGDLDQWYSNTGLVDSSNLGFGQEWGISINSAGQVAAGMSAGFNQPAATVYSAARGLGDGQSHIAIFTRAENTITLYVDGGAGDSRSDASTVARAANIDMVIGGIQTNNRSFTGDIAEVRIYNGALTDPEAADLTQSVMSYYHNSPPTAIADLYSTPEDPLLFSIPAGSGVLANDTDAEFDSLSAELISGTQHGQLSLQSDGSFIYEPDDNFFGTDTFTYRAIDLRPSNAATVSIEITPVYDPVVPVADTYKLLPSETVSIDAARGVLVNDSNPERARLSAILNTDVAAGMLTFNADGSFSYDPRGFTGSVSFSYRVNDGTTVSGAATVTLLVNSPPTARDDTYRASEDTLFSATGALSVLANDADAENDRLTAMLVDAPSRGTLGLNPDGSFVYNPEPNYFGPDVFTYKIADWADESSVATVRVNVVAANDPPNARPDMYFGSIGQTIVKQAHEGLLANDSDVDSAVVSTLLSRAPRNGRLNLQRDGSFTYTPNAGFVGTDTFGYRASDADRESEEVEVTLFVGTSPVRISEILTANVSSLTTRTRASTDARFRGDQRREDWIELENLTGQSLDIGGYHLTDNSNPKKWRFPAGTTLSPFGRLVVFASTLNIVDQALDELGLLHTNFALGVEGEYLALSSPDGWILQEFSAYPKQSPDVSYGWTDTGRLGYLVASTPGESNGQIYAGLVADVVFSADHGFYSDPFSVEISTLTEGAAIRYTIDGSTPTSTHGELYSKPVGVTTTTMLRAAAFKEGYVTSEVTTATYIFIQDVIRQGNSPPGYPAEWLGDGGSGTMPADYEMDPEITQNPAYRDTIDDALLAIPTVSIVTDIEHLFDPQTGIYQRPERPWERPASVELIFPDGTRGFQENVGLRIQGGHTRSPSGSPKHSFRLLFNGQYGAEKLRYDWFGDGAVDEFDTIVLRAGGNQSWIHTNTFLGDNRSRAQYVRDQWAKDTQRAMGRLASHTDYAHLYVNGIYWGLYNPTERPTASFAASYLGGTKEEYDALNAGVAVQGDTVAWRELQQIAKNLADDANYRATAELLDIDAFIDYMILNHYGGNLDWDSHNYYTIRRREPGGKFLFLPWDSEFIFIANRDNRLKIAEGIPGRLFQQLQRNTEFRMLLADHIQRHFFNDGVLTPQSVVARWEARSNQIFDAIVAESARWGDYRRDVVRRAGPFELLERDVQWLAERNRLLNDYFPVRTGIVLEQYRSAGLFPAIDAPLFNQRGGNISSAFAIELSSSEGTVYYTTDGSDPRLPGGAINSTAMAYTAPFRLPGPATVRARVLSGDQWSAIDEASFVVDVVPADASNLRISEINYHPLNPTQEEIAAGHDNDDDFEFIELVNISNRRIDLTNVRLRRAQEDGDDGGVAFDFATGSVAYLEPGQHVLVVEDENAFAFRYGKLPLVAGQWTGGLSNGGEQIMLTAGDAVVLQFSYADEWYDQTDGEGYTLEIIDPANPNLESWGRKASWNSSRQIGGSPGRSNSLPVAGDSNWDGIFNSSDLVLVFQAGEYDDVTPGNSTFEEGDWNGDGDFTTSDFVFVFQADTFVRQARKRSVGK